MISFNLKQVVFVFVLCHKKAIVMACTTTLAIVGFSNVSQKLVHALEAWSPAGSAIGTQGLPEAVTLGMCP